MPRGIGTPDEIDRALNGPRESDPVEITDAMIQAACIAGYGVDSDKDSNLYKLMQRALAAGLAAR